MHVCEDPATAAAAAAAAAPTAAAGGGGGLFMSDSRGPYNPQKAPLSM